jgi:hypothetical protein
LLHNVGIKSSLLVGRDNKQGRAAIENKFPYAFLLFHGLDCLPSWIQGSQILNETSKSWDE